MSGIFIQPPNRPRRLTQGPDLQIRLRGNPVQHPLERREIEAGLLRARLTEIVLVEKHHDERRGILPLACRLDRTVQIRRVTGVRDECQGGRRKKPPLPGGGEIPEPQLLQDRQSVPVVHVPRRDEGLDGNLERVFENGPAAGDSLLLRFAGDAEEFGVETVEPRQGEAADAQAHRLMGIAVLGHLHRAIAEGIAQNPHFLLGKGDSLFGGGSIYAARRHGRDHAESAAHSPAPEGPQDSPFERSVASGGKVVESKDEGDGPVSRRSRRWLGRRTEEKQERGHRQGREQAVLHAGSLLLKRRVQPRPPILGDVPEAGNRGRSTVTGADRSRRPRGSAETGSAVCYHVGAGPELKREPGAHNVPARNITACLVLLSAAGLLSLACKREGASARQESSPVLEGAPAGADRSAFLLNRGLKFLADGQNEEAEKALELARQADSSSPKIAVALGRAYVAGKKFEKAEKLLQTVITSAGAPAEEQSRARELLVELLLAKGELGPAEQACAPLLQGDNVSAVAHRLSGMIEYRKGDPESLKRSVSELKEATRMAPSDSEAATALGLALLKVNDLPGAATALEEAGRLDPDSEAAASNLAKVYEMQGRSQEAESARKRFQEIHDRKSVRQKVGPLRAKGVDAFNEGRLDEALSSFQEILKITPRDPQTLAQIGSIFLLMQKLDDAESFLRRALEVRPEDDFALTELGRVRALRNDLPGAIELLERAARSNPDAPEPHYFLAGIFYSQQRKEDFVREKAAFERLRRTNPVAGLMELPEAPGP